MYPRRRRRRGAPRKDPFEERRAEPPAIPRPLRPAHDDVRDAVLRTNAATADGKSGPLNVSGTPSSCCARASESATPPLGRRVHLLGALARRLDVDRVPRCAEPVGQPRRLPQQPQRVRASARQAHHHPLGGVRVACVAVALLPPAVEDVGDLFQGDLAELVQVRLGEEVRQRPLDPLGRVDLPGPHPLLQVLGRQIHVHDLVGLRQHVVRHALLDLHPGELLDHVVEALEVLDVHRGDDVDAGAEQLLHVLVALGVPAARGVGVGQLVHQRDRRPALEHRVEVHLFQHHAAVLDLPPRHLLQVADHAPRSRPGRASRRRR